MNRPVVISIIRCISPMINKIIIPNCVKLNNMLHLNGEISACKFEI